ncbi:hypothetical protein EV182_008228, partial [Spiromyces aspiralis]
MYRGDLLESTVFRVGLLASLRSKKKEGAYIGVMITASHNKEEDNGVKIVDPLGEMLDQSWESYCTRLVNVDTHEEVVELVDFIASKEGIDVSVPSRVVYARDTRPSGPMLRVALEAGLDAMNAEKRDYGIVTTPQLHYFVRCLNTADTS